MKLNVNGKEVEFDVDPETPLLWVLRDTLGLTGTKYGCGIAQCGGCTVHVDGVAIRSCQQPVGDLFQAHRRALVAAGHGDHMLNVCGYTMGAMFAPTWMEDPLIRRADPQ